jgi:prevent-host-death family protein
MPRWRRGLILVAVHIEWSRRMPMDLPADDDESIAVSAFKPRSLELIERVASGRASRIVLTKRGRPVAALVPVREQQQQPVELWGALRDLMEPVADVDLTEPMGEVWAAERG